MDEDPWEIAQEHIAWCLTRGQTPYDVFAALGLPAPLGPRWRDAILAVARAASDIGDGRQMKLRLVA